MKRCLTMWCIVACLCGALMTSCNGLSDAGDVCSGDTDEHHADPCGDGGGGRGHLDHHAPSYHDHDDPVSRGSAAGRMTLRQKAAQVLLLAFDGTTLSASTQELLAEGPPGGILLLGHNVQGAEQTRDSTEDLQKAAAAAGSGIGLFIAVDQEGGLVQRIHEGVPEVPRARKLGEDLLPGGGSSPGGGDGSRAPRSRGEHEPGARGGCGRRPGFVPVPKDLRRRCGLVSDFVTAVTEAYADNGLISVVKHFPGHGSASGNTHGETVISNATQAEFETVHLPPFRAAIAAGAEGVMMAHIIATAYDAEEPASRSAAVIEGSAA